MPVIMYEHDSIEAPVTFQNVSAYFSEEEWALLHGWQKDLYNKVMNEVHQALISLGPLIATTVYTLRTKEMKDGCTMGHRVSDKRHRVEEHHAFNNDKDMWSDHVFKPNGFVEHHNVEEEESVSSFTIGEADVTQISTLQIKEEEETYFGDDQESDRTEIVNCFEGTGTVNMQQNHKDPVQYPECPPPCKVSSRKNNVLSLSEKPVQTGSEMSEHYPGHTEKKTASHENRFGNLSDSNYLNKKTRIPESTRNYKAYTIDKDNSKIITHQEQNLPTCPQQKCAPDVYPGYAKSINQKIVYLDQRLRHQEVKRFKCVDCEKSFQWKSHLIRHQAIHCEDKPFQCTICQKCFARNDSLLTHYRTHSGEKPYQCTVCMKAFKRNRNLINHKAMHLVN